MLHYLKTAATQQRHCTSGLDLVPYALHPRQQDFVNDDCADAFYGGAAGGGKSIALLAAAAKYLRVPGYSALILRKSYADLAMPGGLIPLSKEWFRRHGVYNQSAHKWTFPGNVTLTFGYLDIDKDFDRYQGGGWQFIACDEITQMKPHLVRLLHSRIRGPESLRVPWRFRGAGNPGGPGHEFIKEWYVESDDPSRKFYPARLQDNPSLNYEQYAAKLANLDPLTRQRLLDGDWDAIPEGGLFKRQWFANSFIEAYEVPGGIKWLRYWDLAATVAQQGTDPDWTVGAKLGRAGGVWYLVDVRRMRGTPEEIEGFISATAIEDGRATAIRMEEEPGSSGKSVISHYRRNILSGFDFSGVRSTGDKATRAAPVASAAEGGIFKIARGIWNTAFMDEVCAFPLGTHDDQVDAVSGAMAAIVSRGPGLVAFTIRDL